MGLYRLYCIILENPKLREWIKNSTENRISVKNFLRTIRVKQPSFSDHLKTELWQRISFTLKAKTRQRTIRLYTLSAAASVAFFVIGYSGYTLQNINIITTTSKLSDYVLPDSSVVDLNTNSELSYNKLSWFFKRNLTLKGEAYFRVKKGTRFTVNTLEAVVSVLGTSFNVFARESKTEINCYSGKVRVELINADQESILTQGLDVLYEDGQVKESPAKIRNKPEWASRDFSYTNKSFFEVFSDLEHVFGVTVSNKNDFRTIMYTGYFNNGDLNDALELILTPLSFSAEINNKTITIIN